MLILYSIARASGLVAVLFLLKGERVYEEQ